MARWLTIEEMVLLKAGQLPVLYSSGICSDEPMELCIGWAASEGEAYRLVREHPKVAPAISVLPGHPDYRLIDVTKRPIAVGDEDGLCSLYPSESCPGTYFYITAYVPVYGLKKLRKNS